MQQPQEHRRGTGPSPPDLDLPHHRVPQQNQTLPGILTMQTAISPGLARTLEAKRRYRNRRFYARAIASIWLILDDLKGYPEGSLQRQQLAALAEVLEQYKLHAP